MSGEHELEILEAEGLPLSEGDLSSLELRQGGLV